MTSKSNRRPGKPRKNIPKSEDPPHGILSDRSAHGSKLPNPPHQKQTPAQSAALHRPCESPPKARQFPSESTIPRKGAGGTTNPSCGRRGFEIRGHGAVEGSAGLEFPKSRGGAGTPSRSDQIIPRLNPSKPRNPLRSREIRRGFRRMHTRVTQNTSKKREDTAAATTRDSSPAPASSGQGTLVVGLTCSMWPCGK